MIIYMLYVVYMCVIKSLFGNSFVSVNKYHCGSDFNAGNTSNLSNTHYKPRANACALAGSDALLHVI